LGFEWAMWSLKSVTDYYDIDEITIEVFDKYKYALAYIGVDFNRDDVREVVASSCYGMEEAFQATISYWMWKKDNSEEFEHPSAFLIKALSLNWKPISWSDNYLENPEFKSPCQLWWEKAASQWGKEVRDKLVADVSENESGEEYIYFLNGKRLSLKAALNMGFPRVLEYGQEDSSISFAEIASSYLEKMKL
jgi:hypothetical protein